MTKSVATENSRVQIDVTQVSMLSLLGTDDKLLKTLENAFPKVEVLARGNKLTFSGPTADVERAKNLIEEMILLISNGQQLAPQDVTRSAKIIDEANLRPTDVLSQSILSSRGKSIRPKTLGQKLYVDSIDQNTIVLGV